MKLQFIAADKRIIWTAVLQVSAIMKETFYMKQQREREREERERGERERERGGAKGGGVSLLLLRSPVSAKSPNHSNDEDLSPQSIFQESFVLSASVPRTFVFFTVRPPRKV